MTGWCRLGCFQGVSPGGQGTGQPSEAVWTLASGLEVLGQTVAQEILRLADGLVASLPLAKRKLWWPLHPPRFAAT
jgi:hypothetical protein